MKKVISFVAVAALTVGGFTMVGCSNQPAQTESHDQGFAGGNGAFGETPRTAGDYSNRVSRAPATQPASNSQ